MPLIYDKGFSTEAAEPSNIIGVHDRKIIDTIISQLQEDDIFINTTWIKLDSDLKHIIDVAKTESRKVYVYSGADWDNRYAPEGLPNRYGSVHNALSDCDVSYIGNTLGEYYFSFWIYFVYENLHKYTDFNTYDIKVPMKHYMCLNRKPHRHRIELINEIKDAKLLDYGYVSYGTDKIRDLITLSKDIKNIEGDIAVGGDVGITNDINSLGHQDNWNNHFLNVVSETTTYTDVFLTEKTLKPIVGRRPFIILGDRNIYKLLQDLGFDTFEDMYGTGHSLGFTEQRINWIVSNLKDLINKGDAHLPELFESLKPRLEHNFENFVRIAKINRKNIENLLDK